MILEAKYSPDSVLVSKSTRCWGRKPSLPPPEPAGNDLIAEVISACETAKRQGNPRDQEGTRHQEKMDGAWHGAEQPCLP